MSHILRNRLIAAFLAVMIVVNMGVFQATTIALAAGLTDITDVVGDQTQGESANHLIAFTTPSGAGVGETITLTFASAFDTTLITEDDVDIADDGVQLTTAADCSGVEEASVTVGSDVVTITLCASGAIAPSSEVEVAIGTNATNSGTGSNQITNPAEASYFLISIDGTFGDFGSIVVTTTEVGSIDVELIVDQVDSAEDGGGRPSTPSPEPEEEEEEDATAPVISNVDVVEITSSSAVITWDTDEDAGCGVDYGETTSYGDSVSEGSTGTSHSVELTGLSSDTEYFFLITCEDESGNASDEGPASFTTETDPAPANISDFACSEGDAQIDFSWVMPSDGDLAGIRLNCSTSSYPADSSEGTSIFTGGASSTSATVIGLTNGTTYYCSGFAYDEGGNEASGAVVSCTPTSTEEETPTEEPPVEEPPTEEPTTPTDPGTGGEETPDEVSPETPPAEEPEPTEPTVIPDGPTTTIGTGITSDDVSFTVADGTITLPVSDETFSVIPGTAFTVRIPEDTILDQTIESIYLTVDGSTYLLGTESVDGVVSVYAATITAPSTSGTLTLSLRLVFTDGTVQDIDFTMQAVDLGYVYELMDRAVSRVSGAAVSLLQSVNGAWVLANVSIFGDQSNPTTSASDGTFAWYVANGLYRVEALKLGYEAGASATFTVSNNIATANVELVKQEVPVVEPPSETPTPIEQVTGAIGGVVEDIGQALEDIREIPEVQVAADIAIPTAVVLGTLSVGVLTTSFNLLPLLQYLFTSPFLLFARRKRKAWGVVYNAATKLPIDLAIVRLYRLPENRLVATRVTDKAGRYFFLAQPGEYRLEALKPSFAFPTTIVQGKKTDGDYLDVYHGETIMVNEKDATIAANVPLDPSGEGQAHQPRQIVKRRVLRRLTVLIAPIGLILALAIMVLRPGVFTIGGFILQALLFLVSLRLAKPHKPKSWGIVYESGNQKPMAGTVVRIFEPQYNKLLETAITDSQGRYSFLVGPSTYFTTYEKAGYAKQEVRPIDLTQKKGVGEVAIDVAMNKANAIPPQKN